MKANEDVVIENIRRCIANNGYKQGFIAQRAGFTPKEFSNLLNKRKVMLADHIPKICEALNITPNQLFKEWEDDQAS